MLDDGTEKGAMIRNCKNACIGKKKKKIFVGRKCKPKKLFINLWN